MNPGSRLLLVRHGQSTWNADGRWQGQADPPLSDLGVAQARRAAVAISALDGGIAAIWSSDLERAHHTARLIAEPSQLSVVTDARVREREAGPWTGLTRDEIEARFPGYLADGHRPPGYEADALLAARALNALEHFADRLGGAAGVVVTHGGVIITIERQHGAERAPIQNLEGRWLRRTDTGFTLGDRVALA